MNSYSWSFFLYYAAAGLLFPYFPILLRGYGFDYQETSYLSAVRPFIVLCIPPLLGWAMARWNWKTRPVLKFCVLLFAATAPLFYLPMSFTLCLLISALHFIFRVPMKPLLESLALSHINRGGGHYGRIRILGSLGFTLTALLGGKLFEWGPIYPFVSAYFICALLCIPFFSNLEEAEIPQTQKEKRSVFSLNRRQFLFLSVILLRSLSHTPLMLFLSIFIREELGVEFRWIGFYWLVAVFAEMILLYFYRNIFQRKHCFLVMGFSLVATMLRLFFMSHVETPTQVIVLQLLHAFTFASFYLASIDYVEHLFPGEEKTMGLSLVTSVSLGLSVLIGMNLCGILEPYLGIRGLFLAGSGIPIFALILLFILRFMEPKQFQPLNPEINREYTK